MAEFLTSEKSLEDLYRKLELTPGTALPSTFQLLFRFKPLDHELIAGEAKLVDQALGTIRRNPKMSTQVETPV